MTMFNRATEVNALLVLFLIAVVGCQKEPTVSYSQNVRPIIDQYCIGCHQAGGKGFEASGFNLETYEGLMKGTFNGPMVIAGDSLGSNMLVLMEGRADPSIKMPHGTSESASKEQLDTIRSWIDQGAQNN